MKNLEVRLIESFSRSGLGLYLLKNEDGKRYNANEVRFEVCEEGNIIAPVSSIDKSAAQVLMDDLWNVGIRPTITGVTTGQLKATEKHLQDMRCIVADRLRIKDFL